MSWSLIDLCETGWIPDRILRAGIRHQLRARLRQESRHVSQQPDRQNQLARQLAQGPLVACADEANRQHYEVPTEFFEQVLGRHWKYSSGYWASDETTLNEAEAAMLDMTSQRAQIEDGQRILELGCGWGSLTLWLAERYPQCSITALSNSQTQRAHIESICARHRWNNVRVVTANIANFQPDGQFDRVVSVEMFEHVRNHCELLRRIASWMTSNAKLFVHIFCHRQYTYLFEDNGTSSWMGQHFFSGGMMPAANWFHRFPHDLCVRQQWEVNGRHYARTCEAWLNRLDQQRREIDSILQQDPRCPDTRRQLQRWRIFFMACAELFAFHEGREWFVAHYLLEPAPIALSELSVRVGPSDCCRSQSLLHAGGSCQLGQTCDRTPQRIEQRDRWHRRRSCLRRIAGPARTRTSIRFHPMPLSRADPTFQKSGFAVGQIVVPSANEPVVEPQIANCRQVAKEASAPAMNGLRVVRRDIFVVEKLEISRPLHGSGDRGQARKAPTWEHVLLDEIDRSAVEVKPLVRDGNRLQCEFTIGFQQP